jgi:hypothetical protein
MCVDVVMSPQSLYPIAVAELLLHRLIFLLDHYEKIWGHVLGCLPIKPIVVLEAFAPNAQEDCG